MTNQANIEGNRNIILQDVTDSEIIFNIEGSLIQIPLDEEVFREFFDKHRSSGLQVGEKIYNFKEIGTANFKFILDQKKTIRNHLGVLPVNPDIFKGRNVDLQVIHDKFFSEEKLILLLSGHAGIGKTALATKYYRSHLDKYAHLIWVFADDSLTDAVIRLAPQLNLVFTDNLSKTERFDKTMAALHQLPRPSLLIADHVSNLDELNDLYEELRRSVNLHIILTSRIPEIEQASVHRLEPLSLNEALELFKEHYPKHDQEENEMIQAVFEAIGYNTLIIEVLAKVLRQKNRLLTTYSLSDLREDLQKKGIFSIAGKDVKTGYYVAGDKMLKASPPEVIEAMYDMEDITKPENEILSFFAILPSESIHIDTVNSLLVLTDEVSESILSLASSGWLEFNEVESRILMTPVIQDVIKRKNKGKLYPLCRDAIDKLTDLLDYEADSGHITAVSYEKAAQLAGYAANIISIIRHPGILMSILCERTGNYFQTTGDLDSAQNYYSLYLEFSKKLDKAYPEEEQIISILAISHSKLGQISKMKGELTEALESFNQYRSVKEGLHNLHPQNLKYTNGLSIAYSKVGDIYKQMGELEKANEQFLLYQKFATKAVESDENNPDFLNDLAISHERLGDIYNLRGELKKSLANYEQSYEVFQGLHKAKENDATTHNALAISLSKIGNAKLGQGILRQALISYQAYNEAESALFEMFPEKVEFQYDTALSQLQLGKTYMLLRNIKDADKNLLSAKEMLGELVKKAKGNISFAKSHASAVEALGGLALMKGDVPGARRRSGQFLEIAIRLGDNHQDDIFQRYMIIRAYAFSGDVDWQTGKLTSSKKSHNYCLSEAGTLSEKSPGLVSFQYQMSRAYLVLGEIERSSGNCSGALRNYLASRDISDQMYLRSPLSVSVKHLKAIGIARIAQMNLNMGEVSTGIDLLKEHQKLEDELVSNAPDAPLYHLHQAISREKMGKYAMVSGEYKKAKDLYEDYRDRVIVLNKKYPDSVDFHYHRAVSYRRNGEANRALDNSKGALKCFTKYHEWISQLHERVPESVWYRYHWVVSLGKLASLQDETDFPEAGKLATNYLQQSKLLHEEYATHQAFQHLYAEACKNKGNLLMSQNQATQALNYFGISKELSEKLILACPSYLKYKYPVAQSLEGMGDATKQIGNLSEAQLYYGESLKILVHLKEVFPECKQFTSGLDRLKSKTTT